MNNIRHIFNPRSLEKLPTDCLEDNKKICYYPSSGYDFRHIFYWDYYCQKENLQFPDIFIHSDFTCLDHNPYPKEYMGHYLPVYEMLENQGKPLPHPILYKGYILDVFGGGNSVVIKNWTELYLLKDVFYPNRNLFLFADQIRENTHKVFAIECQLINLERDVFSLKSGSPIKSINNEEYTVINPRDKQNHYKFRAANKDGEEFYFDYNSFIFPTAKQFIILLFTMENSNFFYDVLLENKIKIDFLTHINDGGASFGGSMTKMDFIYLYSETLGLKNMIIDLTLEQKQRNFIDWMNFRYYNPKLERDTYIRKYPEINLNDWSESRIYFPESTGIYIRRKWDTGHDYWNYSDFDEKLYSINEACEKNMRLTKGRYYVHTYYHYKRK